MEPDVICGWLADIAGNCPPAPPTPFVASTKRAYAAPGAPPSKKRQRIPLGEMDPNPLRAARRTSPRKLERTRPQTQAHRQPSTKKGAGASPDQRQENKTIVEYTEGEMVVMEGEEDVFMDPDVQNTPRAPRAQPRSQYSQRLAHADSLRSYSLPASSASTTSSRARSTSPVKRADDLLKLERPVRWTYLSASELRKKIAGTNNAGAAMLFNKILRKVQSRKGYLPLQLREHLQDELGLADDDTDKFADRGPIPLGQAELEKRMARARRMLRRNAPNEDLEYFARVQEPLEEELDSLVQIVDHTSTFKTTPHAEAAWNEQIHGPMLKLAVLPQLDVGYENVTRANIARTFLPQAPAELGPSMSGKMIDYAMVLIDDSVPIRHFVDRLEHRFFNQTSYPPLCFCPAGLFIETKADSSNGWSEGKAQLGLWLAAWFKRVSMFSSPPPTTIKLPFMPVLLVVGDKWELHFGFEHDGGIDICGGLEIGGTSDLNLAYLLLDVLRLLAHDWVASEFRTWVATVVQT
ncbi:hypothetical protein DL766_008898 [Monosporascus sp. MC13-8B]|uniref:PD-(D/E)XK nuclease-like domain-containing protein n=1 Tax=Monosporascus cannonballus TaxID=155416 RepID=A0ABY0H116_9PEZI|nr:hypothetical protein DL763_010553 [Monosporascus cannonballus]RYO82114.1 hypothetical protein DL762_006782 [Monosporascus cannonballus]RYP17424.1 hypothetical protein DL766_008898 [Monosporascus sp. MC13-8B]